jgi:hypothetical protein
LLEDRPKAKPDQTLQAAARPLSALSCARRRFLVVDLDRPWADAAAFNRKSIDPFCVLDLIFMVNII